MRRLLLLLGPALVLAPAARAAADETPEPGSVPLLVQAGRPLRVALDARVRIKRVGQPVNAVLLEPVYAYDRVVIPAGSRVIGQVARLDPVSRGARARAMLRANFSPPRGVTLRFDTLVLPDGRELDVCTEVRFAAQDLALRVREDPAPEKGVAAQAAEEAAAKARETLAAIKKPGKGQRLKETLVGAFPFHPQYLRAGSVYTAVLQAPLDFGRAAATPLVPPNTTPPPGSILHARLLTPLDSARTPRGSPVRAVVTRPLFSEDERLILPEGTVLSGEVTFARPAGDFHRNGQLRFLFETVQAPDQDPEARRASLYSVQTGQEERLALDDEGGATVTSPKSRFAAPALAGLALAATLHRTWDFDTDGLGPEAQYGTFGSRAVGGFLGLGLIGALVSQLGKPVAVALGVLGLVRTLYASVAGKGRDVSFPADTVMEVQLGAGPEPRPEPRR